MLHFRILNDSRIRSAMAEAHAASPGHSFLDIVKAVLENLPELLGALHDPAALVRLILKWLGFSTDAAAPASSASSPATAAAAKR